MTTPIVQAHHIFGFHGSVANSVLYFDDQSIIYPSGSGCVRYNVDQKWQKFVTGSEKSQEILALALSPNRRYLAISEKGEKATVSIYDIQHEQSRKRKSLSVNDLQAQEFVSIAFSPDSKYLVVQSGQPDWTLIYWLWKKQKIMGVMKTTTNANRIYQVSFNPQDNAQICVVGDGVLKLLRFADGNLKQTNFQKLELQNFLTHAWMSEDRIIVGTDLGKLYLFELAELRWEYKITLDHRLSVSISQMPPPPPPLPKITSITIFSKGFLCAAGPGVVYMFERAEEKDAFKKTRVIRIPQDLSSTDPTQAEQQEILTLCLSPSEEILIASTNKNQLYSITLSSAETSKGEMAKFEILAQSFHSNIITGLDVCIRKPLFVTSSVDRSIRLWNYETNVLELYKEFQEEAYSVSLHPSGLYILVGFSDKLRLMNLLIDDVRSFREFTIRSCRECSFSHGGHLFAVVNGNVIHIYTTTTFENQVNLKGHNGKIRAIAWNMDDSKLVSCGMDGAVYEWNTLTGKRESECVLKTCSYTGICISPDGKSIFAVGSDRTLKEITDSQIIREIPSNDVAYTAIVLSRSGRMLFLGTAHGTVRSMKVPLPIKQEWNEYQAHNGPITKMAITYDDLYLLTISEDSCLMIWKIIDKEGRVVKRDKELGHSEEILITKSDLQEKNQLAVELKTRVEELKMENEYQLRLKDMNYNDKIKELTEKFIQEMEALKTKNQVLKTDKDKVEIKHKEDTLMILDKHTREIEELETMNNQKLMLEYEKYQELQMKSQRMQEDYERQLSEMDESKTQALEELTEYYETKLQEKSTLITELQEESRHQIKESDETKKQIEEDCDREIQDIKIKYERNLRDEKEANLRLKGETGIMRKKFTSLQKEIEDRQGEIEKLKTEQQKLHGVIRSLEKDIQGLKKEILERDETIQDKEKRIYDLKKKNQELEKFKFVLDYKIKELKQQIEPRENDIKEMKEQIQQMETELELFHKQNTQLELNIGELKQKLKATEAEMRKEMEKVHSVESVVKRFKTDVYNCVGFIQDPKKLKESVQQLYEKYVPQSDVFDITAMDSDIQREFGRQRNHLEKSIATLQKKLVKDAEIHRADNVRIMQENVVLIKEINDLRQDLKIARIKVHDLEVTLGTQKKTKKPCAADFKDNCSRSETITRLNFDQESERIIEMQRLEMNKLREKIQTLEEHQQQPGTMLPALHA
ncbi:cilia- and flagella-associated protein 57 [Amblyraja radiata]|uniref:cilia- and flagella-associated protein 57 n=1 Tax=Amblyraja radiata TaxID=386614 RepID=UPI001402B369|nr:cilia- and flagella-associated protein 57 [Amblyraja radiata]